MRPLTAWVLCCALLSSCHKGPAQTRAPGEPQAVFAADKKRVTLLFGGDASVARGIADMMRTKGKNDPAFPFQNVKALFDDADLTFVNVECVLSDSAESEAKKKWRIRAPTKNAEAFASLGVDVVSVANNHALDFGKQGFSSTLKTLDALHILPVGAQLLDAHRQDPVVVQVGQTKVGFLGYNAHGDEHKDIEYRPRSMTYKRADTLNDIREARKWVDVLVVSMHWGWELSYAPWDWQRDDAHAMVDAGADLIIGHHPHVVEPVEEYKGSVIAYSLGDLLFDKSSPWLLHRTNPRFLLKATFEGKRRVDWSLIPMRPDDDYRPHPDASVDTSSWIEHEGAPVRDRLSEHLQEASVTRVMEGNPQPCTFDERPPAQNNNWLRWLAPRFACSSDKEMPWTTVARTAETSGLIHERGIWAPPQGDGPVQIKFPAVLLADTLSVVAGFPDWWVQKNGEVPGAQLRVFVEGMPAVERAVPRVAAWQRFSIDTAKARGLKRDVTIEITGGEKNREDGFVVDAWAETAAAGAEASPTDSSASKGSPAKSP